jgi:mono/diheme cytochrome c family protein
MSAKVTTALFLSGVGFAAIALAAGPTPDQWSYGQQEFQAKCAVCHGASGKGDGALAWALGRRPPDLTTYAARNGGTFPLQRAVDTIDGRQHAGRTTAPREMPVWGIEFREGLATSPEPPTEPEWHVNARLMALTEYVSSLQTK